jgi:hypothetical protein
MERRPPPAAACDGMGAGDTAARPGCGVRLLHAPSGRVALDLRVGDCESVMTDSSASSCERPETDRRAGRANISPDQ